MGLLSDRGVASTAVASSRVLSPSLLAAGAAGQSLQPPACACPVVGGAHAASVVMRCSQACCLPADVLCCAHPHSVMLQGCPRPGSFGMTMNTLPDSLASS